MGPPKAEGGRGRGATWAGPGSRGRARAAAGGTRRTRSAPGPAPGPPRPAAARAAPGTTAGSASRCRVAPAPGGGGLGLGLGSVLTLRRLRRVVLAPAQRGARALCRAGRPVHPPNAATAAPLAAALLAELARAGRHAAARGCSGSRAHARGRPSRITARARGRPQLSHPPNPDPTLRARAWVSMKYSCASASGGTRDSSTRAGVGVASSRSSAEPGPAAAPGGGGPAAAPLAAPLASAAPGCPPPASARQAPCASARWLASCGAQAGGCSRRHARGRHAATMVQVPAAGTRAQCAPRWARRAASRGAQGAGVQPEADTRWRRCACAQAAGGGRALQGASPRRRDATSYIMSLETSICLKCKLFHVKRASPLLPIL